MTYLQQAAKRAVDLLIPFVFGILAAIVWSYGAVAREYSEQEKQDIAQKLTADLPAIQVTYTGAPVISGDKDPIVFKITPSGKSSFGQLFLKGRYEIIHRPDDTFNFGAWLCHLGQEFARGRRKQNSSVFIPKFDVEIPVKFKDVGFEIKGDQETAAQIVYGILYLWDFMNETDYGHFKILVRGFADEGPQFVGTMLPQHPINKVLFLPPMNSDPIMLFYLRTPHEKAIGASFQNADLPELRATYLKEIIDAFLVSCNIQHNFSEASEVLKGAVIDEHNVDYRSIEIFFYAYN